MENICFVLILALTRNFRAQSFNQTLDIEAETAIFRKHSLISR